MEKKRKDPDFIIKLEKAICEKYGEAVVENPKSSWTLEQEKEYLKQIKEESYNFYKNSKQLDKIDINGVLIPSKLFNKETNRTCISCKKYSFKIQDDLYMNKFKCCKVCYLDKVKGNEEGWLKSISKRKNNG